MVPPQTLNSVSNKWVSSTNYYATEVRMAVKANSGIKSLADLNGKAVVTTQGTTSDKYIKMNEKAKQLMYKIFMVKTMLTLLP